MTTINLLERVPPDYHRLFLFFGENDFRAIICVDVGTHGEATKRSESNCLDWQARTVMRIRMELQALEKIGEGFSE